MKTNLLKNTASFFMRTSLSAFCLCLLIASHANALVISGQVTKDGAPARSVKLYGSDGLKSVVTDKAGNYKITVKTPGTYLISVLPGSHYLPAPLSQSVTINSTDQTGVNFTLTTLSDTSLIFGRIAWRSTPLEGVTVTGPGLTPVQTDRNGIYIFNNLNPGRYYVYPYMPRYTFSSPVRSIRLTNVRNSSNNFSAQSQKPEETYPTWFSGLFDMSLQLTSNTCPTDRTGLNGPAGIYQTKNKVSLKLSRLGTYSGLVNGNGFNGQIRTHRFLCSVTGNSSATFSDPDHAAVTGDLTLKCLLTAPCSLSFSGTAVRKQ